MPSPYTPSFSTVFSFPVWKIIADAGKNRLYVETRNGDTRRVLFHAIDLNTKKSLWADRSFLDPWWANLKYAVDGYLLVVGFNDPEMPEQKGMAVVNGQKGEIIWSREEAQVMHTESDGLIVSIPKDGEADYVKVGWETGSKIRDFSLKEMFNHWNKKEQEQEDVAFPFHFEEDNSFFVKIKEYIEIITGHIAVRLIEYLEKGDKVLISYYIYTEGKWHNYILVADENGNKLLHELMKGELNGIGFDTFFVLKDQLIIVKNSNELQAYVIR